MVSPDLEDKQFKLNPRDIFPKIFYLCHPYTGNISKNVYESIVKTNKLLDLGYFIFNPILHSHFLHAKNPRTDSFWYDFDLKILECLDGIILPEGWERSKGCRIEREFAESKNMEILMYEDIVNEM